MTTEHCAAGVATLSEIPISTHETFRADVATRGGKQIIAVARWKQTPSGPRRTGQAFEFARHRLEALQRLLTDVAQGLPTGGRNHEAI